MSKYRLTEEQVTKVIVNAVKALHEEVNKQRLAESTDKKALNEVKAKRNEEYIAEIEGALNQTGVYLNDDNGDKFWWGAPEAENHARTKNSFGWISYRNVKCQAPLEPLMAVIGQKVDDMAGNGRPTVTTFADAIYDLKQRWRDKLIKYNRENGTSVRALRGQKDAPAATEKIDIHAAYNQFKGEAHRLGIAMDVNSEGMLELDGDEAKCMQMVQFAKEQGFPNGAIVNGKEVK